MPRASHEDITFDPYGKGVTSVAVKDFLYRTFPDIQIASGTTSKMVRQLAYDRIQQANQAGKNKSTRSRSIKQTDAAQSGSHIVEANVTEKTGTRRSTKTKTSLPTEQSCPPTAPSSEKVRKAQPVPQATCAQSTNPPPSEANSFKPSHPAIQQTQRSKSASKSKQPSVTFAGTANTKAHSVKIGQVPTRKTHTNSRSTGKSRGDQGVKSYYYSIDELDQSSPLSDGGEDELEEQEDEDEDEMEYEDEDEDGDEDKDEMDDEDVDELESDPPIEEFQVMYSESEHEKDSERAAPVDNNAPRPIHQYLASKRAQHSAHIPASRKMHHGTQNSTHVLPPSAPKHHSHADTHSKERPKTKMPPTTLDIPMRPHEPTQSLAVRRSNNSSNDLEPSTSHPVLRKKFKSDHVTADSTRRNGKF